MRYPDGYKVGEEVKVSINLRGREYTDKDGCKILQRNQVENQHRGGTICSTCQTQIQARLTNTKQK
jgi:translation initiation factor IF-3